MLEESFLVAAVGHPVRLQALVMFERTPASARELGEVTGLTPSAALYHVRKLADQGLIETHELRKRRAFEERVWRPTTKGWGKVERLLRAAVPPGQPV